MVDLARFVNNFNGMRNEYINADDKTNTDLYQHIKNHGNDMSCIKLSIWEDNITAIVVWVVIF